MAFSQGFDWRFGCLGAAPGYDEAGLRPKEFPPVRTTIALGARTYIVLYDRRESAVSNYLIVKQKVSSLSAR